MFRRPGKNPHDKENTSSLYQEEPKHSSPYPYGKDVPSPRIFEPSHQSSSSSLAQQKGLEESWKSQKTTPLPHPFQAGQKGEEPETTLGEGVTFRGELKFERLLRIDGFFEGELLSKGKVVVGPKGTVKANLNLKEAIVEGKVEGNITVEGRLELRQGASVEGDIKASSLSVDDGVRIIGLVEVDPSQEESDEE